MSCRVELVQLDHEGARLRQLGVALIGVTFDEVDELLEFKRKENLSCSLARDPDGRLARALGVLHEHVGPVAETFYPTKILIDPKTNQVRWLYAEDDLRVRLGADAVLAAIEAVLK